MRDSSCRWCIVKKKLKNFEVMLKTFELSRVWEIVESWLVYENRFSWITKSYFSLHWYNKTKLVQSGTVLTVIIPLYLNETS